MKTQCRTCGAWFLESEMFDTDYRTYAQQGDPDEMVCEGCYDNYYGKCTTCGAIREATDLKRNENNEWVCNLEVIDHREADDRI